MQGCMMVYMQAEGVNAGVKEDREGGGDDGPDPGLVARGAGEGLDGPLATAVDVVDGILQGVVGRDDAFVPLDWEGRAYEGGVVFVRGEVRDYVAEEAAAALLGEALPPRAIGVGHHGVDGNVTR